MIDSPGVLHVVRKWLPLTQTWLYQAIRAQQRLLQSVHVLCDEHTDAGQFQIANLHATPRRTPLQRSIVRLSRIVGIAPQGRRIFEVGNTTGAKIIHSHFGQVGWESCKGAMRLGARHVVSFYGVDVSALPRLNPTWYWRYCSMFRTVDLVLCEGPHMAQSLCELGCPSEKVAIQRIGIDVGAIAFRPRTRDGCESLRVMVAASFREKKGIPDAIAAVALAQRHIPISLTIIGDSSGDREGDQEKIRIAAALRSSGLADKVRMLGFQTPAMMMKEAYEHHVFLHPSVTAQTGDSEGGAPVAIMEMMASGMAVVSTNHCDIPAVIGPELQSMLAPEREPSALAERLISLFNAPDKWYDIARKGRTQILQHHSLENQVAELVSRYHSLL